VPFITTAAFQSTGSRGNALIYLIAVPAVCFILCRFLLPETRKISIGSRPKLGLHSNLVRLPGVAHDRQHDIGCPRARRLVAGRHDRVQLGESLELAPAQRRVRKHLAKRL
jgi:hypothetical protein